MGRRHPFPGLGNSGGDSFFTRQNKFWDGHLLTYYVARTARHVRPSAVHAWSGPSRGCVRRRRVEKPRPVRASIQRLARCVPRRDTTSRVRESTSDRVVETMRFGLVPSFTDPGAKVDFYRMFNARSETIAEKGVFSRLLQRRRGVVLINGFYEWAAERAGSSQVKQPYYLHLEGKGGGSEGDVLRCAALYDRWKGGTGGELVTVTIITVEASEPRDGCTTGCPPSFAPTRMSPRGSRDPTTDRRAP